MLAMWFGMSLDFEVILLLFWCLVLTFSIIIVFHRFIASICLLCVFVLIGLFREMQLFLTILLRFWRVHFVASLAIAAILTLRLFTILSGLSLWSDRVAFCWVRQAILKVIWWLLRFPSVSALSIRALSCEILAFLVSFERFRDAFAIIWQLVLFPEQLTSPSSIFTTVLH